MDKVNIETINDEEVVVKKRGRPRKTPLEDVPPKKAIGRPLGSVKEGPRAIDDKEYFKKYYNEKLKDNYVVCKFCGKSYQKCRLHRHEASNYCKLAQTLKRNQ